MLLTTGRPGPWREKTCGSPRQTTLALAVARACIGTTLGLALPGSLLADTHQAAAENESLDEVVVVARQREFTKDEASLSKLTEPLLNTPQSVLTLSEELLRERGVASLNGALRTVPGITLGAGEFSWQGNNPSIRGFSSRNDMFLDGIRDFGSYSRDPFNLASIEVLLGPSSMLFGRGSTGGVINQVSKTPTDEKRTAINVNVGNDSTLRGTLDANRPLSDTAAVRINLMAHRSEVADRDVTQAERYGVAPSLAVDLGSATRLTLSYMHQSADNVPDYGLPWFGTEPADVSRDNFYGFNSDYLETTADMLTADLVHGASESVDLRAQVRYANYTRDSRLTEPLVPASTPLDTPLEDITIDRHVFIGNSDESMLFAQANATIRFVTNSVEHALVTGIEAGLETSEPTFGIGIGVPGTGLLDPVSNVEFMAASTAPRVKADTESRSVAAYVLDTVKFGESWHLIAGLRWDRFDTAYDAERFDGPATPFSGPSEAGTESIDQVDNVVSYRSALVYKPVTNGTLYVAWGTSFNPSAEGLSFITTGRALGLGNQDLDPEENESIELGTKWELADAGIKINGSLFQVTKKNARVPDPDTTGVNILAGEQRMRGASLDVSGFLTEKWQVLSGYTYLDGEVVDAATGAAPAGSDLTDAPAHNASVWTTYQLSERFMIGGGARYLSQRLAKNSPPVKVVDSYWTADAMVEYRLSNNLLIKFNLTNVSDEFYIDQLHPWHVVPGPGLTGVLAVNTVF